MAPSDRAPQPAPIGRQGFVINHNMIVYQYRSSTQRHCIVPLYQHTIQVQSYSVDQSKPAALYHCTAAHCTNSVIQCRSKPAGGSPAVGDGELALQLGQHGRQFAARAVGAQVDI